jgi:hypothetical protein
VSIVTEPHIHEDREVVVERESNPTGAVVAVIGLIILLLVVWLLFLTPRGSGPSTNPGGAPGATNQATEQAPKAPDVSLPAPSGSVSY